MAELPLDLTFVAKFSVPSVSTLSENNTLYRSAPAQGWALLRSRDSGAAAAALRGAWRGSPDTDSGTAGGQMCTGYWEPGFQSAQCGAFQISCRGW